MAEEGQWGEAGQKEPIKVTIRYQVGLNIQQTGFHVVQAGVTTADEDEVLAVVQPWVNDHFRTLLGAEDRIVGVDCVNLYTADSASWSPANLMGTISNASVHTPAFMAIVCNLRGAKRRKYGHGRMFLPLRTEAWTDREVLTTAGAAAYQSAIDALSADLLGNDVSGYNIASVHGVLPPKAATATRPARPEIPAMWHEVTSIRLNTVATFLRSRKAGVGS